MFCQSETKAIKTQSDTNAEKVEKLIEALNDSIDERVKKNEEIKKKVTELAEVILKFTKFKYC